jgi:ABC-2 type transport system permease protein
MPPQTPWTPRQTLAQFRAIAWLRWRIVINNFRRKGGAGELVGRILMIPMLTVLGLLPTLGAGVAAWYFASHAHLPRISWLLWGAFILCQLLNINLGRPGTTFNPNELIRFPVRLRSFVAIRLFFGLLAPANILISLMSLAIAVGVGVALPSLWFLALVALSIFAAANVLFTRMVFAWVDRWLSTRRAREVFTLLIFTVSIGFQFLNVRFNPAYNHHHRVHGLSPQHVTFAMNLYHRAHPLLVFLPPDLTASALIAVPQHRPLAYLGGVLGTAIFAAVFLAIFALRMRKEFRGEVLSDVANAVASPRKSKTLASAATRTSSSAALATRNGLHPVPNDLPAERALAPGRPRSAVGIIFAKELLYVRRNIGLLYALIVPVVMVFLFAGRITARGNSLWVLPGAIAYTLLSVMPLSYNSFGLEAGGAQFYFLAPVRLRDVFLAKNLLNVLLALIEIAVVLAVLAYIGNRPPLSMVVVTLLWAIAALLIGLTFGNLRSISAPKRIEFTRAAGKQASSVSALMSMAVLLILATFGAGLFVAARLLHATWVLLPAFTALALLGVVVYLIGLRGVERYAQNHREELFAELSKP